jgi:integrase/recombinase XerD
MTQRFGAAPMQSLTQDELERLLTVALQEDIQDFVAIGLMFETFGRVSEVLSLRRADILPDGRVLMRRLKGSKTNVLPIRRLDVRTALQHALDHYVGPEKSAPIFSRNRRTLDWRIKRYCKLARIPEEKAHAHTLKHAACNAALEETGGNVVAVQKLAGHADLNSTARYLEMSVDHALDLRENTLKDEIVI